MTPEQRQGLLTRISKVSSEPEKVVSLLEAYHIHPARFGLNPTSKGGYEYWIEDCLEFHTHVESGSLCWGAQAYVPAEKVENKDLPLEADHLRPTLDIMIEVRAKQIENPSARDYRVTYLK